MCGDEAALAALMQEFKDAAFDDLLKVLEEVESDESGGEAYQGA